VQSCVAARRAAGLRRWPRTPMKLLILSILFLASAPCCAQPDFQAIGARDAAGAPEGEYRIIGRTGMTRAQGHFKNGKMDGVWVFIDWHKVKIAEITYRSGDASGPFRTFLGSSTYPVAAGSIESEGTLQSGQLVGQHVCYRPGGKVFSRAILDKGKVSHVVFGSMEDATRTAAADTRFVQTLEGAVHSIVH